MGKRAVHLGLLALLLPLAACNKGPLEPVALFRLDMQSRCNRLKVLVEREIGRELGYVEVRVVSEEQLAERGTGAVREAMSRFENGPTGAELEAEARRAAESRAYDAAVLADSSGGILVSDQLATEGGPLLDLWVGRIYLEQHPELLDVLLLHELIHLHQDRHLSLRPFLASVKSRTELQARLAVLKGHAQYLTRRISARVGIADIYSELPAASPREAGIMAALGIAPPGTFYALCEDAARESQEEFFSTIVEKLGYQAGLNRILSRPPTLIEVSRPEEYFLENEPTRSGPLFEDLRRWLARECGSAYLDVVALPQVRVWAGEAARGFREGFLLKTENLGVELTLFIAESAESAQDLHGGWTEFLEARHAVDVAGDVALTVGWDRRPDSWLLHRILGDRHQRRLVVREGRLLVDVHCEYDSELEMRAERLARRAIHFMNDSSWRKQWLEGDEALLESKDAGLRLAAVSRLRRFVEDDDWEVRWLGLWYAGDNYALSDEGRDAMRRRALDDPHGAIVARALRAWHFSVDEEDSWSVARPLMSHKEAAVRRAAWESLGWSISLNYLGNPDLRRAAVGLVAAALEDTDLAVRVLALRGLGDPAEEPGFAAVIHKAFSDDHPWVRMGATSHLAHLEVVASEFLPDLLDQLGEHPDDAAEALGLIGPEAASALPKLRDLLTHPKARFEAAHAIWRIGGEPGPLLDFAREVAAEGRGVEALGDLREQARPVVAQIAQAFGHHSAYVRMTAAETLGKIGGPQAKEALRLQLTMEKDERALEAIRKALKSAADD